MPSKTKPAAYRLSLKPDAICAIATSAKKPFNFAPIAPRADGGADVAVTMSIFDQITTFAKPGENLSDTVRRIYTV